MDPDDGIPQPQRFEPVLMVPEGSVLAVFAITNLATDPGTWAMSEHLTPGADPRARGLMPKYLRAMADMIELQESSDELLT